jgi:hypothetical protein
VARLVPRSNLPEVLADAVPGLHPIAHDPPPPSSDHSRDEGTTRFSTRQLGHGPLIAVTFVRSCKRVQSGRWYLIHC